MYVGLKQPLGDGERCVTPARATAKETTPRVKLLASRQTGTTRSFYNHFKQVFKTFQENYRNLLNM